MNEKFGIAIVGTGMAAAPHARALKELSKDIDVRGVYSRNAKGRNSFAAEYGFPSVGDIENLARDAAVDAALILTPPNARNSLVELFASNGKHILCEKPLERTVAAALDLDTCCRRHGVELGIVFQHRFREASRKLAERLSDGSLGKIFAARADVPWWRDQSYYDVPGRGTIERDGGGVLISQAIHTLDLMLSFTGPASCVQALTSTTAFHSMESEDFAVGGLQFENGAVGSVIATTASFPGKAESISLDCENGSASLNAGILTIHWRSGEIEEFGSNAGTGGGADPMAFPCDWHRELIASFTASVRSGVTFEPRASDSIAVQRLIAAFILSSDLGRRVSLSEIS